MSDLSLYIVYDSFSHLIDVRLGRKSGGVSAQLSRLSKIVHPSVTENVGTALAYRRIVGAEIKGGARKRTVSSTDYTIVLAFGQLYFEGERKKEVTLAIEADNRLKDPEGKGKGKGKGESNGAERPER